MGFGHLYVDADQPAVIAAIEAHLAARGLRRAVMRPEFHPAQMKQIHENDLRLFWVSPRIGNWTGIFEFRYYNNENRERWGYTDETLAAELSRVGRVYRMEVLDQAGFWLYNLFEGGAEKEGKAHEDLPAARSTDPSHPRYELNRIIEREGIRNIGLGYEHIPGPEVRPIEKIPHDARGVEGLAGFVHLAFARGELKPMD